MWDNRDNPRRPCRCRNRRGMLLRPRLLTMRLRPRPTRRLLRPTNSLRPMRQRSTQAHTPPRPSIRTINRTCLGPCRAHRARPHWSRDFAFAYVAGIESGPERLPRRRPKRSVLARVAMGPTGPMRHSVDTAGRVCQPRLCQRPNKRPYSRRVPSKRFPTSWGPTWMRALRLPWRPHL